MNSYKAMALGAAIGFSAALFGACGSSSSSSCSATNCSGCCDTAGKCQAANTTASCGANGGSCVACGTGQACVAGVCGNGDGGVADAGQILNASCTATCVLSDGGCAPGSGTALTSCGKYGYACTDCTATGGTACTNHVCVGGSTTGTGSLTGVGASCGSPSDCSGVTGANYVLCKQSTSFGNLTYTGGYCTHLCSTDSQCGTGLCTLNCDTNGCQTRLAAHGEGDNFCMAGCTQSSDCQPGYACYGFTSTKGACWLTGADGGVPPVIDAGVAPPGVIGKACTTDVSCQPPATGACDTDLPDGSCTTRCEYSDTICGAGSTCVLFGGQLDGGAAADVLYTAFCLANCNPDAGSAQSTCRAKYTCEPLQGDAGIGVCYL